jgi:capsular exopolysaccharide synthesis family protein
MDRIQKALEKAQENQLKSDMDRIQKALEEVQDHQQKSDFSDSEQSESDHQKQDGSVYTQTKKFVANHDIMRARRIVAMQRHDPLSGIFQMLRTKILKQLRENNWNSFAVTAPTQGAGKSMVAVNLAISMAMEVNQTVLLVDMDLKYPKVHWYFNAEVENGLLDYLNLDLPLSDVLLDPGFERLVLLPGRGQVLGSSELLSGPKMRNLVEEIKGRYQARIVIFDLPTVLAADDVLVTMNYYDAALLVVEEGGSKPEEVRKALQMLSGTNLLGTVLNKAENLPLHQGFY